MPVDRRELIHRHPYSTNLQKRIYLFLLGLEDNDGIIRVRQQEIADAMGVARPSVNRALRRLPMLSKHVAIRSIREGRGNAYWFVNDLAANPMNRDRTSL